MKLLLIEDNSSHVEMLRQMLTRTDRLEFTVHTSESLAQGLAALRANTFDLILLDLGLPDSIGFETFAKVLANAGDTPIIILSGVDDEELAIQTVKVGAQDYLVKSHLNHHWLIRSIRYALERAKVEKELRRAQVDLEQRFAQRSSALREANEALNRTNTERRKSEDALQEAYRQIAELETQLKSSQEEHLQADRLQSLGNMAAGIAHDFNNTLTPILGFTEHLLSNPDDRLDPKTVLGYISKIHAAALEGAEVISRLKRFYQAPDVDESSEHVDLNALVMRTIELTRPHWYDQALAKGVSIEVHTELDLGNPTVFGNRDAIEEMLTNLIFHAAESISRQGTIHIRTVRDGNETVLHISDNGLGMSEVDSEVSLQLSYRKKVDLGIGLGLGAVKEIVKNHSGRIDVESTPGMGTRVSISLPSKTGAKNVSTVTMSESNSKPAARLLVVEDEPMVREILEIYLREDQHEVDFAVDGTDGLAKFRTGSYNLVLTDRAMPGLNGDQLALEIKAINPNVKVILLTGYGELMMSADEKPEGIDLIVSKPFTMNSLRQAIAQGLGGS